MSPAGSHAPGTACPASAPPAHRRLEALRNAECVVDWRRARAIVGVLLACARRVRLRCGAVWLGRRSRGGDGRAGGARCVGVCDRPATAKNEARRAGGDDGRVCRSRHGSSLDLAGHLRRVAAGRKLRITKEPALWLDTFAKTSWHFDCRRRFLEGNRAGTPPSRRERKLSPKRTRGVLANDA
jgi:hypothetical protein